MCIRDRLERPHVKILTPLTALALGSAAVLALASCSGPVSGGDGGGEGALKVVATTTQLTDFASQVGGDDIELTGLLAPGGSAHHFDPTPADLLALGEADVLIVNGAGLDEFVDSAIEASGFDGTVIDASDGVDLAEAKEITLEGAEGTAGEDHDHADEHADEDHAAEHEHDHADEGHADEHDHDHEHGDLNPHLWTSPRLAQGLSLIHI